MRMRALSGFAAAAVLATAATSRARDAREDAFDGATPDAASSADADPNEEASGEDATEEDAGSLAFPDPMEAGFATSTASDAATVPGAAATPPTASWGIARSPPVGDNGPPGAGDAGSAGNVEAGFDSWGDAAVAADQSPTNLDAPSSRAVIGCAGCSTPAPRASGAGAWIMTILAAAARAHRRRRQSGPNRRNRLTA